MTQGTIKEEFKKRNDLQVFIHVPDTRLRTTLSHPPGNASGGVTELQNERTASPLKPGHRHLYFFS